MSPRSGEIGNLNTNYALTQNVCKHNQYGNLSIEAHH